jgi:hypothetical protein
MTAVTIGEISCSLTVSRPCRVVSMGRRLLGMVRRGSITRPAGLSVVLKCSLYMVMGSLMVELSMISAVMVVVSMSRMTPRTVVSLLVDMGRMGMSICNTGMCERSVYMTADGVGMVFGGGRSSMGSLSLPSR